MTKSPLPAVCLWWMMRSLSVARSRNRSAPGWRAAWSAWRTVCLQWNGYSVANFISLFPM